MLQFAALIINKGVAFSQIATIFVAIIPTFLEIAIPLATLLGIMLAFARLSGDSEIVVIRASGVSLFQLLACPIAIGIGAALVGTIISLDLKPWGYRTLTDTIFQIARTRTTSGLEQGIFNKLGDLTIYAEEIEYRNGGLSHVLIDDRRSADTRKVIISKRGTILSDDVQRQIVLLLQDGVIHETVQGKYAVTHFDTNSILLNPDELLDSDANKGKNLNELTVPELSARADYITRLIVENSDKQEISEADYPAPVPDVVVVEKTTRKTLQRKLARTVLERDQRYSLPFASVALALLAMPLGVQPPRAQRAWGAGLSALLGLFAFVIYYGLFSVGIVLAQNGAISPFIGIWTPNLVVFGIAVLLLYKTGNEQWQSVAGYLYERSRTLIEFVTCRLNFRLK